MRRQDNDRKLPEQMLVFVPPGDYRVVFEKCERGATHGAKRIFVHCRITEGDFAGTPLVRFYNEPQAGRPLARSSNMFQDYMRLHQKLPPIDLKPEDFLTGCELLVEVVTVGRVQNRAGEWEKTPDPFHYSKIDRFLEITVDPTQSDTLKSNHSDKGNRKSRVNGKKRDNSK